jgi:hypothetical protein
MPADKQMAAIDDWVDVLAPYDQQKIQAACIKYLRDNSSKRPTPGAILRMIDDTRSWREKPESEWTDKDRTEWARAML